MKTDIKSRLCFWLRLKREDRQEKEKRENPLGSKEHGKIKVSPYLKYAGDDQDLQKPTLNLYPRKTWQAGTITKNWLCT